MITCIGGSSVGSEVADSGGIGRQALVGVRVVVAGGKMAGVQPGSKVGRGDAGAPCFSRTVDQS